MAVTQADCGAHDGLRERKKAATRRALGIAAMRLAVQRGLDNVLVEDIAAEAGVSTRTFNNYFASKHEAICALAMERGRLIGVALRNRPPSEPLMEAITSAVLEPYTGSTRAPEKGWIRASGSWWVTGAAGVPADALRGATDPRPRHRRPDRHRPRHRHVPRRHGRRRRGRDAGGAGPVAAV
jgi:AcrR family transcriptional regulator